MAALALTLSGFAAYVGYEGYFPVAKPPVAGDVATYGFGTTTGADGKPLKGGEKITPPAAVQLAVRDVEAHSERLKGCLEGVSLTQNEFDAYLSLALNVGTANVCKSSIPAKLKRGDYAAACKTILDFKKAQGRDCSLAANKSFCGGIWIRRQGELKLCLGEQP
ncbi:MAG: glycoside hydrolase family protein [Zoogloeaceae bacterium]|nr:glycoside hydrolase family protein [Zoogloeaceae bacterium]